MGCIRLLLAIAVVLGHLKIVNPEITNVYAFAVHPYYPVRVFFVISGFYMALILEEKYLKAAHGIWIFYLNRYFRLAPSYWIIGIATILLTVPYPHRYPLGVLLQTPLAFNHTISEYAVLSLVIFTNVFMFLQDLPSFFSLFGTNAAKWLLMPQGWSIGMELTFYILCPYLVKQKLRFLLGLIVFCYLLEITLLKHGFTWHAWQKRFFGYELLFFILGLLAYRFYKYYAIQDWKMSRLIGAFMAASLTVLIMYIGKFTPMFNSVQINRGLYLGIIAAISLPFIFSLSKKTRWDRFIGELSYPVYLSHFTIGYFFSEHIYLVHGFFLPIVTIIFCIPLVFLVEIPGEKIRHKILAKYQNLTTISES